MRDEIKALSLEGWVPSKTNGGHIKLQHPDTEIPVFCSSTPGDKKTHLYLRKDCRNALMGTTRFAPQAAPVSEEELRNIMKSRKDADKPPSARKGRHVSPPRRDADRNRKTPELRPTPPQVATPPQITPEAPPEPVVTQADPVLVTATPPEPKTPAKSLAKPNTQKEMRKMNMMTPLEDLGTEAVTPPSAEHKPALAAMKAPAHEAHDPRAIEYGIQLGLRLARGELTPLVITAEMVGQTLLFEKAPYLIGQALTLADPGQTVTGPSYRKNSVIDDTIMELLNLYPGQEVTLGMIAEETVTREQYKNIDSARASLRKRLERLDKEGIIIYRNKPGEPHARLKV